jgi:hypothetical protein
MIFEIEKQQEFKGARRICKNAVYVWVLCYKHLLN